MLQLTPQSKIFLAIQFVDFRRGIDGLAALCRQKLLHDPFSGAIFLFRNRSGSAIKILVYDGQGFWLCQKRLSKGKFIWWPKNDNDTHCLSVSELQILLWNGDPTKAQIPEAWRKVA
jgi:transposase